VSSGLSIDESAKKQNNSSNAKVAIMQPYLFPYIGYFHLIEASEIFVFYDDVNFIKQGWINRNRILLQSKPAIFTVPVSHISSYRPINTTLTCIDKTWRRKFHETITQAYRKSPYFHHVLGLLHSVFDGESSSIADLAIKSIGQVYDYLGMTHQFKKSSAISPSSCGLDKEKRITTITKQLGYTSYVNSINGRAIYNKSNFKDLGIELYFVKSKDIHYKQFGCDFVPWLSIIDVLMFNDVSAIKDMFTRFELE
jgi:hypothetical protein